MTQYEPETMLRELHRSLDERWRPEEVAQKIVLVALTQVAAGSTPATADFS